MLFTVPNIYHHHQLILHCCKTEFQKQQNKFHTKRSKMVEKLSIHQTSSQMLLKLQPFLYKKNIDPNEKES